MNFDVKGIASKKKYKLLRSLLSLTKVNNTFCIQDWTFFYYHEETIGYLLDGTTELLSS